MSNKAADIDVYYGKRATEYDEIRTKKAKWQEENDAVDQLLSIFEPGDIVIDIPVGTMRYIDSYTKYGLYPEGMDVSTDMLAIAKKKLDDTGHMGYLRVHNILEPLPTRGRVAVCTRMFNHFTLEECQLAMRNLIDSCQYVILGLLEPPPEWYQGKVKWPNRHRLKDITKGLLTQVEEQVVVENKKLADYKISRIRRVD